MAKNRGPRKPPKNPKREEIPEFNNIVNGLANQAEAEKRYLEQTESLLNALEMLKSDGNRWTRFLSFIKSLSDYSEKQMDRDVAQITLVQSKLRGEYTDPGEDIDAFRSWKQIEEYCEELDFNPRDHATLKEAKAALKKLFEKDD